jgi:hypothetical protein
MKVGVIIVMIVLLAVLGAVGELRRTALIDHLVDEPFFFKCAERTIEGDAIQTVKLFFDVSIGKCGLTGFQKYTEHFVTNQGNPQTVFS